MTNKQCKWCEIEFETELKSDVRCQDCVQNRIEPMEYGVDLQGTHGVDVTHMIYIYKVIDGTMTRSKSYIYITTDFDSAYSRYNYLRDLPVFMLEMLYELSKK